MAFILDQKLQEDCYKIISTENSEILLSKNSLVTWFIIVPFTDKIEWYEIDIALQIKLLEQINLLSKILKNDFGADKINIATIGNIVNQLHIHVVGRKKDDLLWPGVVWGKSEFSEYSKNELANIINKINKYNW